MSVWTFPISSTSSVAWFSRCMCCLRARAPPVHMRAYFIFSLQTDCVFPHHWRPDMEAAYALRDYVWWSIHLLSSARLFLCARVCVLVCVCVERGRHLPWFMCLVEHVMWPASHARFAGEELLQCDTLSRVCVCVWMSVCKSQTGINAGTK